LAQETYEFEIDCANSYTPSPYISDYAPLVCEICHCFSHDNNSNPYYIFVDILLGFPE